MTSLVFVLSLLMIFLLGVASAVRSSGTQKDYYLAGSSIPPWLTAISAVATLNSGYMFIGVIGFAYVVGLDSIWLIVGWIIGDFLVSLLVYRQVRIACERTGEVSFPALLANWHGTRFDTMRRVAAVVSVLFLCSYAAAQIAAGGKAFSTLDLRPEIGSLITAGVVLAYSAAGGIRASIWTDAAQFSIMFAAMSILVVFGVNEAGGLENLYRDLTAIPGYLDLYPDSPLVPGTGGLVLFVVGWVFAGVSIIGQPHIMVRYMALDDPENIGRTRIWYYSFYVAFAALSHSAGLIARVLLPEVGQFDPELALPVLARALLPEFMVGLILAGIFAATMSTIDSLVLSSSAAISNDLLPGRLEKPMFVKGVTSAVTVAALILALSDSQSVFDLVILSWSTLGALFAPVLLVLAMNRQISERSAIFAMVAGVSVALGWRYLGLQEAVYEGMPGVLTGFAIAWARSSPSRKRRGRAAVSSRSRAPTRQSTEKSA